MERPLRNFWQKTKSDQVIELWRRKWSSLRSIFHRNPVSDIWLIAIDWNGPLGVIWAIRWPYQSLDIVSWPYECHWHWSTKCLPIMAKFAFSGVSGGPDTKDVTIFHTDRLIRHLYRFRCHSGPLAQFALGRFFNWGSRCSFPGCHRYIRNIPSRCRKNKPFSSEWKGEHAGFMSLLLIVFFNERSEFFHGLPK